MGKRDPMACLKCGEYCGIGDKPFCSEVPVTAPTPERRVGEELTAAQKMTLAVALSRVERTEPLVFALVELMTDRGEKLEAEVSALHAEIDDCHRRMNQQTAEVERLSLDRKRADKMGAEVGRLQALCLAVIYALAKWDESEGSYVAGTCDVQTAADFRAALSLPTEPEVTNDQS